LSSTPLRPNRIDSAQSDNAEKETGCLQYESPIWGHKIRPRKLVNALAAEDKQLNIPVKESPRKIASKFSAEKENVDLNVSLTSDKATLNVVSKSGENKQSVGGKIDDLNLDNAMDISVGSVSADSRTIHASRASKKTEKAKEKVRNSSSDGAGTKKVSNNFMRTGTDLLKSKQVDRTNMDSLNLSILKQEKFDKQTGLIARLEKAMEKTREALNRSLTSHDLMNAVDMEKEDVVLRGDEAPQVSERLVNVDKRKSSKPKSSDNSKRTGVESSPILVERFSKPAFVKNQVKSFVQVAKNSPVTKEKLAKLVQAQKEASGKIHSLKKVSRTPTKMFDRPKPDPKVMESKTNREPDTDTSQEVSPSKRRRMLSPSEPRLKTSTAFDSYLAEALNDTGNKRSKFHVYEGKLLPRLRDTEDETLSAVEKKSAAGSTKAESGVESSTFKEEVDGVSHINVKNHISGDSEQKSPNVTKRSLLSEFKEDIVTNDKSPVTKAFLSPMKMNSGVRLDLINSFSPIKKFNGEKGQSVVHTMSHQVEKHHKSSTKGYETTDDKTLIGNSKLNAVEKSPDMRRPKLLDRDTGDLYTMSQNPQKSPKMGAASKASPRATLTKTTLGHLSEASKKISSLPTPDEFLKSLAGKRSSVRKSRGQKSDEVLKSECLDRPKTISDDKPKSESGAIKKDRAQWERPPVNLESRNSRLLAPNQRPTWIKPQPTKRLSLTNMLDNPSAADQLESENHKSDLIQNFYSKFLKYSAKDKVMKERNSDNGEKSNDVCSTESALLKKRIPSCSKSEAEGPAEFSEKIPPVSKTVSDSGVVIPRLSLESKNCNTLKENDVETASIATLDDVSSIASVRSLPANEEFREDARDIVAEPSPPLPTVDLQKTACSAWKKTAPVKPKPVKPQAKLQESPKKGSKVTKKVTCTAPLRSEKLKQPDPLSSFLPIHPYPVTPSSNDVLTAPKVITKIVVEEESKDKTNTSENLDDSEIVRVFDNAGSNKDIANRDNLVNSLSTIGLALQRGKISMVRELSKTTSCNRLNRNNNSVVDPLSKIIGYSSYRDNGTKTEPERENIRNRDSSRRGNDQSKGVKSYTEKDPLRNTIGVSSGRYLKTGEQLSYRSSNDNYEWREHGHSDKIDLNASLERNFEARQLGESLLSTYDSVTLRSTLDSITSTIDGSTLREKTVRHSTVDHKSDTDGRKSHSHQAR
jgi:hypothetical protein